MRNPHLALSALTFLAWSGGIAAQTAPAASAPAEAAAKTPDGDRLKLEFASNHREVEAYYPNDSQARLTLYSVVRYDGEIAKPRETFMIRLTGFGIVEPLRLEADDSASIAKVVAILERFKDEAEKSGQLKAAMAKRKADADAALSREETRLVELKSATPADAAAIAASEKRIADLKTGVAMADEIVAMPRIAGVIGKAKLNVDRPEYEFVASFEPAKSLFTLSAGYSFRIVSRDVKYYLELLKRVPEIKTRLLDNEAKDRRVRAEIDGIFAGKAE